MEISAIQGGGAVRRLIANAIRNVHIFWGALPFLNMRATIIKPSWAFIITFLNSGPHQSQIFHTNVCTSYLTCVYTYYLCCSGVKRPITTLPDQSVEYFSAAWLWKYMSPNILDLLWTWREPFTIFLENHDVCWQLSTMVLGQSSLHCCCRHSTLFQSEVTLI